MPATLPEHKTELQMGPQRLELGGKYLGEMRDSNSLLGDRVALKRRLDEDGYLLIRGLHDREAVLTARRRMLERLQELNAILPGSDLMDGVISPESKGGFWKEIDSLKSLPAYLNVVNGARVTDFFKDFLGGEVRTYDYKWLRVIGNGDFTGAHYDVVYMGRGTLDLYTTWTPIGNIPFEMGPLAVCVGSHNLESFAKIRATYGKMDVDRDHVQGWFDTNPVNIVDKFGGRWVTTEFEAGDALIFGMFTMHASLTNVTNRYRLTSDTRYQLASAPVDERWVGPRPKAHYAWRDKEVTMEDARKQWGV